MQRQMWLDGMAGTISLACLVHCLLLPLLFAAIPTLSDALDLHEAFHRFALLVALPTSALALVGGYRRHRSPRAAITGAGGLAIMAWAAFGTATAVQETLFTVAGSLMVAGAHLANWRPSSRRH